MKLKFLMLPLAAWCFSGANAQTTPNALVMEMKDGSSVSFLFEEEPRLRFLATDIVVKTGVHETSYPQNSVQKYVFAYKESGSISLPAVEEGGVSLSGNNLYVSNLKQGTKVSVISIDGRVMRTVAADSEGNCAISLASLPSGIYLLNYADVSVKIVKP